MTIGIPRALLYYRYHTLWLNFFKNLDINVIISPKTNKQIIDKGSSYVVDEACLSLKIFMGHVDYLKNKCDYILIPRISTLNKDEKVCTNFQALYDLTKNVFPNIKILHYNLDIDHNELEYDGFIKIGKTLGFSYFKILKAYYKAKLIEQEESKKNAKVQLSKLKADNLKILLVAHQYNLYDDFVGRPIVNYLEKEGISVILSDIYSNNKICDCNPLADTIYWTFNKELIYCVKKLKEQVDGIILLSTFPCGPDSLSNELLIRRIKNKPIIYLTADGNSSDTGLITRLESFIDIIRLKK